MVMSAGFLDGAKGPLFHVLHTPAAGAAVRGSVLYAHPFAEEHNKSRRMAARQARALAEAGYVVLMPDLFGCGDSAGDFADADWAGWLDDLRTGLAWLQARHPAPVILWGLRTGCLLLGELCAGADAFEPTATVYWQPVINGELFLTQFLRLRMAAGMIGGNKETTRDLRARLDAGESLEVAGYALSPQLASGLASASLQPPSRGSLLWLEVVANETSELAPASRKLIDEWRARGIDVLSGAAVGETFWSTQEISEVPELLSRTMYLVAPLTTDPVAK